MVFVVFLVDIRGCSDNAVFVAFLFDIGAVPTMQYLMFFELLAIVAVPTV